MSDPVQAPSVAAEIAWMAETITAGFKPGELVDEALLDQLVAHLNTTRALAEMMEDELAVCRNLIAEIQDRKRTMAATLHTQPEAMQ